MPAARADHQQIGGNRRVQQGVTNRALPRSVANNDARAHGPGRTVRAVRRQRQPVLKVGPGSRALVTPAPGRRPVAPAPGGDTTMPLALPYADVADAVTSPATPPCRTGPPTPTCRPDTASRCAATPAPSPEPAWSRCCTPPPAAPQPCPACPTSTTYPNASPPPWSERPPPAHPRGGRTVRARVRTAAPPYGERHLRPRGRRPPDPQRSVGLRLRRPPRRRSPAAGDLAAPARSGVGHLPPPATTTSSSTCAPTNWVPSATSASPAWTMTRTTP